MKLYLFQTEFINSHDYHTPETGSFQLAARGLEVPMAILPAS